MSYIIAFIKFPSTPGETFPVDCFRTDIAVGDEVLVLMPYRQLTRATVVEIRYLNWNCGGQIRAKASEASEGEDGYWSFRNCPSVVGVATSEVFIDELRRRGWISLKSSQTYMAALTNSNQTLSANILVRKNGVDLQILPEKRNLLPQHFCLKQDSLTVGRVVRHYLSNTTFNLYEGILRFSDSFMSDEGNYDRFFKPVGTTDKRTEKQKWAARTRRLSSHSGEPNGLRDYYEMVSDGSGDSVYGGDGMWIDSGGGLHE